MRDSAVEHLRINELQPHWGRDVLEQRLSVGDGHRMSGQPVLVDKAVPCNRLGE
jgi:hypothetical protein